MAELRLAVCMTAEFHRQVLLLICKILIEEMDFRAIKFYLQIWKYRNAFIS